MLNILYSPTSIPQKVITKLRSFNAIVPVDIDGTANYVYVTDENKDNILSLYGNHLIDLKSKVEYEEIKKFSSNIEKDHDFEVGDWVKVKSFGDAPFKVISYDDEFYELEISIVNDRYRYKIERDRVSKHNNPQPFVYNIGLSSPVRGNAIIDFDSLVKSFSDLEQTINFIYSVKTIYPNLITYIYSVESRESDLFRDFTELFNLPVIDKMFRCRLLVSNDVFKFPAFRHGCPFDDYSKDTRFDPMVELVKKAGIINPESYRGKDLASVKDTKVDEILDLYPKEEVSVENSIYNEVYREERLFFPTDDRAVKILKEKKQYNILENWRSIYRTIIC